MRAFILGLFTVCIAVGFVMAGASPNYVPNPAVAAVSAVMGGDVTGTVGANTVISATTAQLTSSTMTRTNNATLRRTWTRFDWTNAMVVALGASTTGDIQVCTLPAKTVVTRAFVVIKTAGSGTTTLTVAVGRTSATFIDYVTANDAQAAANTVYGATKATIGTHLYDGVTFIDDLPSWTATTAVNAHFISSGGNLSAVLTSTGSVYIESEVLP